jgi:hypothetical protein
MPGLGVALVCGVLDKIFEGVSAQGAIDGRLNLPFDDFHRRVRSVVDAGDP